MIMFKKKTSYTINIYKAPPKDQSSFLTFTRYNWDIHLDGKLIESGYSYSVNSARHEAETTCRTLKKLGKYTYKA